LAGDMWQTPQLCVGKVLSRRLHSPPTVGDESTRYTCTPAAARMREACMPATPPPTTSTDLFR